MLEIHELLVEGFTKMRLSKATSTLLLLLTVIFFVSLAALTSAAPYNHNQLFKIPRIQIGEAIAFSAFPLFSYSYGYASNSAVSVALNQTTRLSIFSFIQDNPGIHFRALANYLSLPIGVLQYHLGLLVNKGLVSVYRDGRYKRYFEAKRFTETEMKVISALRHETSRKILAVLLDKPETTHKDLASKLDISSQALSWQMHCLEKLSLVKRNVASANVKYSLDATVCATVAQCITRLN